MISKKFGLEKNNVAGKLFTFEGIEGSGKGTHVSVLKEELINRGYPISTLKFYEPGGTDFADLMRSILKQNADQEFTKNHFKDLVHLFQKFKISPTTQSFLFFAARADQLEKKVKAELEKGNYVFLDRSKDSTTTYQGYAQNPKLIPWIRETNKQIFEGADVQITKTIYLDVSVEEGLRRSSLRDSGKKDFFDKKGKGFFEKVRNGYLLEIEYYNSLSKKDSEYSRIISIPTEAPVDEVKDRVLKALIPYLD